MQHTTTLKPIVKSQTKEKSKKEDDGPSETTINNILNYSKALSVRSSKLIDCIEVVLN